MSDINPGNFGGAEGGVNFINNNGQVVGFGTLYGEVDFHPFLWGRGKITDLFTIGNSGGNDGTAYYLNEEGHVIGVSTLPGDQAYHAVLWREQRFTDLGTLPGDSCSSPRFIGAWDQVVGVSADCNFTNLHAFLWEVGEMVDLNMLIPADSGIQLQGAVWMNESGEIAAQGVLTATGDERAVLLVPDGDCDQECEAAILATKQASKGLIERRKAIAIEPADSCTITPAKTEAELETPRAGCPHIPWPTFA